MRTSARKCSHCGQIHWTGEWPRECLEARVNTKRGSVPVPYIRTDGMDAIMNHADGKVYDSRSSYERAVREMGCEILGDDMPDKKEPNLDVGNIGEDVKTAIEQLNAGYNPND